MNFRRLGRAGLALTLLLTGLISANAQADCTEFTDAFDYSTRADTAFDQRLYDDAVLDYTCAIQLAPDVPDYYNGRGSSYYWLGQDQAANADYSKVLELDPQAGYAYNNLANLYANIGDYEQALEYYTTAVTLALGTGEITYNNRASIYIETGEYDLAQSDIDTAHAINPDYADLYLRQAWLNSLKNETATAAANYVEWLERTLTDESAPQYVPNRTYLTRILTGKLERVALSFNSGDVVSISAAAIDGDQKVDPLIVLIAPSGEAVIADDDSGVNIDAVIAEYVATETGTYTLLVGNSGGYYYEGVDGQVRLSVERKAADGTLTLEITPVPNVTEPTVEAVEDGDVSFSTFRLFAGAFAEVYTTEGDHLNLRSGPGLRFDVLNRLDSGTLVTLIEGPRKHDGLAWWRIRTQDGTEGWAVERVDTEQTLQMALITNEDAIVTSGADSLNVRTAAGRGNEVLFQIEDGQRLTILELAPELLDGFQWWRIRLPDGREGWTIDRIEGERMLVPAKERERQG